MPFVEAGFRSASSGLHEGSGRAGSAVLLTLRLQLNRRVCATKGGGRRALLGAPPREIPVLMRVSGRFRFRSGSASPGLLSDAHRARRGGAELLGALARGDLDLVGAALEGATALLAGRQGDRDHAVLAHLAGHAGDDLAV